MGGFVDGRVQREKDLAIESMNERGVLLASTDNVNVYKTNYYK